MFWNKTSNEIQKNIDLCNAIYPKDTLSGWQSGPLASNAKIGRITIKSNEIEENGSEYKIKNIKDYTFEKKCIHEENDEYIIYENKYFYFMKIKS